jgi:hypothetical protein
MAREGEDEALEDTTDDPSNSRPQVESVRTMSVLTLGITSGMVAKTRMQVRWIQQMLHCIRQIWLSRDPAAERRARGGRQKRFDVGNNEWNGSEDPSASPVDTADAPLYPSDLVAEVFRS